jgi:hypothetical protein
MADQETTVPMDVSDAELFADSLTDEPVQETAPEIAPETEQPRDEQGRFVAKDADPAPTQPEQQPKQEPEAKDEAQVPSWRLREIREQREAAERRAEEAAKQSYSLQAQLQAMQKELQQLRSPKQEPVDFFADPDQALSQRLHPIEQRFAQLQSQMLMNSSKAVAIATHGAPAVAEMEQAIGEAMQRQHPEMSVLAQQMRSSDDPVGVAMQWYKNNRALEKYGSDPEAYIEKELERRLAEKQAQPSRPQINLPPSLNRISGSGPSHTPDDGDVSDAALFRHAISGRR